MRTRPPFGVDALEDDRLRAVEGGRARPQRRAACWRCASRDPDEEARADAIEPAMKTSSWSDDAEPDERDDRRCDERCQGHRAEEEQARREDLPDRQQ